MRPRRIASAVLLAATILAGQREAGAFCRLTTCNSDKTDCAKDVNGCPTKGAPLQWRSLPLTFRFSAQPPAQLIREEARAAIRAAFYRWSDILCGPDQRRTALRFVEGEEIFADKPLVAESRGAEPYGIYFRDRGWPYVGKADSTYAQTNHIFGKETGFIEYVDMEINTGSIGLQGFSTKEGEPGADLQAVITHEAGHYIGLGHSKVPTSIMVESYCDFELARCEEGKVAARRLAEDDIDGVCALYPPGYVSPQEETKRAGCASAPSSEAPSSLGIAGFAVLALAAGAARARRARHRV